MFAYNSYMSARILALLGLMCRVQSNRRLRHKTISINVNPLNSFTRFGHHPAVTLLTYRPYIYMPLTAKLKLKISKLSNFVTLYT